MGRRETLNTWEEKKGARVVKEEEDNAKGYFRQKGFRIIDSSMVADDP